MTNISDIVSKNREAVLAVFLRHNVKAQPTPENVIHAYVLHKEPFLVDLYREIHGNYNYFNEIFDPFGDENDDDDFFSSTSNTSTTKVEETEDKKRDGSGWSNFQSIFGDGVRMAGNLLGTGVDIYGKFKAAESGQIAPITVNKTTALNGSGTPEPEQDKTVFYIGGGIAVLILLFIVLKK